MCLLRSLSAVLAVASITGAAEGHEFWIEPEDYSVARGETVEAAIKVGQNFNGTSYAYIPQNFSRFDVEMGGALAPVEGRTGDRPAARVGTAGEGLLTFVHVTRDYRLEYEDWDTFESFVTHKDAAWVLEAHRTAGYPETDFVETYSRYAKSLVAVGGGAGQDHSYGLLTEIVALENPYTGDISDGLDVRVLYQGEPREDAQVEVFAKPAEGEVVVTTVRTDASGMATVPVAPGVSYLLDAVVLREPKPEAVEAMGAVWESLWASLTFAVPD